jgi:hypothetical protein
MSSFEAWNAVVTLHPEEQALRRARGFLRQLGDVEKTSYHNVLVMRVENARGFLRDLAVMCAAQPGILNDISRAVPLTDVFDFATPEEFEAKARGVVLSWIPALRRAFFHVRMHRRGFGGVMPSPKEERFLDEAILTALQADAAPGKVRFDDPDFVIDVETIDGRAGMALWSREDLKAYPFLKVD